MASRKSNEQAMTWLKSMAADKNSLDGINAELVLYILEEQKKKYERLGIQYSILEKKYKNLRNDYDQLIYYGEARFLAEKPVKGEDQYV